MESGFVWLPALMWRANKTWRGVRAEIPWVKRPAAEIIRDHVRLTIQPVDGPPEQDQLERILEQIGSDRMLLFSTDYPHWHFDELSALPPALMKHSARRVLAENALETYPRLGEM
ncbi:putative TIM-barrel fold metal-dependent hydrolase [Bradyrhizobium sp. LB1.3]